MFTHTSSNWGKSILVISAVLALGVASPALAAPHTVTYNGTAVTTAQPGKTVNLKFKVKNNGDDNYSGVKVMFHMPAGLTTSAVSPDGYDVDGDIISWSNVPMEIGQSLYPTLTLMIDKDQPLNKKFSIWVEVTGPDMQPTSTNFSLTSKSSAKAKVVVLSAADIKSIFQQAYGRTPTASELKYWLTRRTDKPQRTALLGAMVYHKTKNINH